MAEFDPPHILPEPGSFAVKCFAPVYGDGSVAVADGDAEFRLGYKAAEVSHLGLWFNFGTWSGVPGAAPYYNIGLEPSIGAADDLDLALSHLDACGQAPPDSRELAWSLRVSLKG